METQEMPITIYSEMTPNPNTMKFVANKMLVQEDIVVEYSNASEAKGSSAIAEELFAFPFVKGVFIARNFITVSKMPAIEWDDITLELRLFIADSLKQNQVVNLLEEFVRPAVENDGGAIHFKSFSEGIVTVILKGSCSGCPSSTATLKGGVEQLLKSHLPDVKEVVAEAH